ncbi:DoxX family protein [Alkanindiges illinoisensis]|uniref:DoxX family protein n=1 Tax=Alkanindiges illinoisensis TaxID=197183 RepID=UPI000479407C|nr:DoxX family protein [Alkanindiges illinoisensis]
MFNPNVLLANLIRQPALAAIIQLLARLALAAIFVSSGWSKLSDYAGTVAYMEAMQVSGSLLPLVIFAELGGGLAILLGFQTRVAALGLAVFSILTALLFHVGGSDAAQQYNNSIHFMKNIGLAGGFLALMLLGAGRLSLDHWLERK